MTCKLTATEDVIKKFINIVINADKDIMITMNELINRIERYQFLSKKACLKSHIDELLKLLRLKHITDYSLKIILLKIVKEDPNNACNILSTFIE